MQAEFKRHMPHHKGFSLVNRNLFQALVDNDFKCSYCGKSLPSHKSDLAPLGVSCGCHLVAEYKAKKILDKIKA